MSDPRPGAHLAARFAAAPEEELAVLAREHASHLDACRDCREALALRDPAALFALLALERKDESFFAGFETRVMAGVREAAREPREGWLGAILRPRFLVLASTAAAVAVVGVVWMSRPEPQIAQGPQPESTVPSIVRPAPPASMDAPLVARPTLLERDAAEPSPVESVASATARVISIKVGGPQKEASDIVLIVDPEMSL